MASFFPFLSLYIYTYLFSSFISFIPLSESKLTPSYYAKSCPQFDDIIQETVTSKQIASPSTAAATLRLFFHDCFVDGCDASIFISSNSFYKAERDAEENLSLPGDGFDVVVRAKTALELTCPGVVSCADIIVATARNLVSMVGGPFYQLRLGRKDSLVSRATNVAGNLPLANMTMDQILNLFQTKGFNVQEVVALSGAHTIGFSHCKEFADRIFNPNNQVDPTLNPTYANALKNICNNYQNNPNMAAFNDVITPGKFDNMYYQNLNKGLGLLRTDQVMIQDPRTKPFAETYAANQTAFFEAFSRAMEKLSRLAIKTGKKGEVRRRCDSFNSMTH